MCWVALLARVKDVSVGLFNIFAKWVRIVYIEGCVAVGVIEQFEFLKLSIQEIKFVISVEKIFVFEERSVKWDE